MPTGGACVWQPPCLLGAAPAIFLPISHPVDASLSALTARPWSERISTHVSVLSHAPSAACDCPVAACVAHAALPSAPTPGCACRAQAVFIQMCIRDVLSIACTAVAMRVL